jgi:hypothetical protein
MNNRNPIGMPRTARAATAALATAPLAAAVLALLASTGCQQTPDQPGYVGNEPVAS